MQFVLNKMLVTKVCLVYSKSTSSIG